MRITTVYDNVVYDERLTADWGFGAYVEYGEHVVLFDTGTDAAILMHNMALLGVDVDAIEAIVLSHFHLDHTGGLLGLLQETGITPTVYMPASFSGALRDPVAALTTVVDVTGPLQILPGIYTTGEMGSDIIEQALVVHTDQGNVVIGGCSHPGIAVMIRRAQEVAGEDIALVMGGFHLLNTAPGDIEDLISEFRDLGVRQVAPSHCTGDQARAMFAEAYGDDYIEAGVGFVIVVG
jgi:7,8-dihydropterin-6-yl-methyl-4-(beta-D-ribofuranosyl)aminobenzene 5'-phosphate synthase